MTAVVDLSKTARADPVTTDALLQPTEVLPLEDLIGTPIRSIKRAGEGQQGTKRQIGLKGLLASRWTWIAAIAAVAVVARMSAVSRAYDIFIDEITYTNIANSVAHGRGVMLYGQPFSLHPPATFGMWALVIKVFGLHGTTESVLFSLRRVSAVFGAGTCILTYLVVERAAGKRVAGIVALVLALDPLAISYDSRVMLEASTQFFVLTTVLFLAMAAATPKGANKKFRGRQQRRLMIAGLAGGIVLCSKETFGLVVVLALILLVLTGWVVSRRQALSVLVLALVGYAVSVVAMGLASGFGVWWTAKTAGVLRLVGARQVTGFNSPQVHVSIVSRVLANGTTFAVTYLILAIGTFAALGLLWRMEPWSRRQYPRDSRDRVTVLVVIWALSSAAYLTYATLFGTIEEQMYYILLVPSLICLCLWVSGVAGFRPRKWRTAGVVLVGLALLFNSFVWVGIHAGHDDEYQKMVAWEAIHVPSTAVVSATDGTSQFLLRRGIIGQWATVGQLVTHHVDYVVIATSLVDQGYGLAQRPFLLVLEHEGRLVFEANGVSDGGLRIYSVRSMVVDRGLVRLARSADRRSAEAHK